MTTGSASARPAGRIAATGLLMCLALCVGCSGGQPETAPGEDNALVQNRGAGKDNWWDALPRQAWTRLERVRVPEDQGWFEVYHAAPGVFAIYEPGQFEEVISYLILGEERSVLFDTGLGIGSMRLLIDGLTSLPVTVVNSHTHYDHIGGNHQFDRVLGTDTGYTQERARGLPHGEVAEFVGEGWIWKKTPPGFDREAYAIQPFEIAETLYDGQVIDLGGRRLEVLLTPGHAPDAVCLLDRDGRLLFTGDTFYPAPLYTHLPGSDFDRYRASAIRLAALSGEVDLLLPAHNEPLVSPDYLGRMANAFEAIADGTADDFLVTDGNREYRFEGFSVIVPAP